MKRDAIASLEKIRELCLDPSTLDREIVFILGQIEWICRHALEDYDLPSQEQDGK